MAQKPVLEHLPPELIRWPQGCPQGTALQPWVLLMHEV